jgi:hypothetical protein
MRIFISSVRRGLETERDALPGQLRALGHEPVRFEDFTAQPLPSREACLQGVDNSDAYLLLLGPHYGHVFPETGQSATHDEWIRAQTLGLPRYIFKKANIDFDEDQAAFAATLGDYASGRFYKEFDQPHDLFREVTAALRELGATPDELDFSPLTDAVPVPWLESSRQAWGTDEVLLEVHVVPLGGQSLSARLLEQVEQGLPDRIRQAGLVAAAAGMSTNHARASVVAEIPELRSQGVTRAGGIALVRVDGTGRCTIAFRLPGDSMGGILDQNEVTSRVASALRLAGQLDLTGAERVAVGLGLNSASMVSIGSTSSVPRTSSSLRMNSEPVHLEPDESVSRAALDRAADEVAASLARSFLRVFEAAN